MRELWLCDKDAGLSVVIGARARDPAKLQREIGLRLTKGWRILSSLLPDHGEVCMFHRSAQTTKLIYRMMCK